MSSPVDDRTTLLVRFGYDGARFFGLQPQGPHLPTAGQALRERLTEAAGMPPKGLAFAARTDAGVSALANLATCWWPKAAVDPADLCARLAAPRDDGLLQVHATPVPKSVHARGSGRGKRYRYLLEDGSPCPTEDDRERHGAIWRIAPRIDVERVRAAARHLEGTHDFSALRGGGCSAATATKTLFSVRIGGPFAVAGAEGDAARRFVVEVVGDAFLRKMMRNLVGLLAEVGCGLRAPDDVPALLAGRDRTALGLCAPPCGLVLVEVGCAWPEDGSALIRETVVSCRLRS
jgi:tRNA pseudouridine38-40 synthase